MEYISDNDTIGFLEAQITGFEFSRNTSEITVNFRSGVDLFPPHKLSEIFDSSTPCRVIFRGVSRYQLTETPYLHDSPNQNFSEPITKIETWRPDGESNVKDLGLEGVLVGKKLEKKAWIDLAVIAEKIVFDDLT